MPGKYIRFIACSLIGIYGLSSVSAFAESTAELQMTPTDDHVATQPSTPLVIAKPESEEVAPAVNTMPDDRPDVRSDSPVAPGFMIQIISPHDAHIAGKYRVGTSGQLELPYNVTIDTHGMTLGRLREAIIEKYSPFFMSPPSLDVSIVQKRVWIEAGGLVSRPGTYLVRNNAPLDEIISTAGGLTVDGTSGFARIEQNGKVRWVDLDEYFKHGHADIVLWQGNDRIFFQQSGVDGDADAEAPSKKVRVLGEVKKPGDLSYRPKADAYYYLSATGGPTTNSDLDHVELVRTDKSGTYNQVLYAPVNDVKDIHESDLLIVHSLKPASPDKILTIITVATSVLSVAVLAYVGTRSSK